MTRPTTGGWRSSPSARAGTTTITHTPPVPATGWPGTKSTATGSGSARCSCCILPGMSNARGPRRPCHTCPREPSSPRNREHVEHVFAERRIAAHANVLAGVLARDALGEDAPRDILRDGDGGDDRAGRPVGQDPRVAAVQVPVATAVATDMNPDRGAWWCRHRAIVERQ